MACIFCLTKIKSSNKCIEIVGDKGVELGVQAIILKHFGDEVKTFHAVAKHLTLIFLDK